MLTPTPPASAKDVPGLSLAEKFAHNMKCSGPFAPGTSIAVAVSGGSDSLALAFLAHQWGKAHKHTIIALTVDHGLRAASAGEARQVSGWCKKEGIEHHILKWKKNTDRGNLQARARVARYELMTRFCNEHDIHTLLVAHTVDDQAETVLLRIMRGSGVDGISAIASDITVNNVTVMRPLLDVSRTQLQDFLTERKQRWVSDPSNDDTRYARVVVRQFLTQAPDSQLLTRRLAQTATHMARSREYIEHSIAEHMVQVVDMRDEGYCYIDLARFRQLHEEAGLRILSKLLTVISGQYYKPRFENIQRLYSHIQNNGCDKGVTLWGCNIQLKKHIGKIMIVRELSAIADDIPLSQAPIIWDGRFSCTLQHDMPDITVGAVGKDGYQALVAKHPEFSNHILPKQVIYTLPAFKNLEKTLVIPHIGYERDKGMQYYFSCKFLSS